MKKLIREIVRRTCGRDTAQFITETTPRYSVGGTNWYHTSTEPFNWTITPQTGTTVFAPVTGATNPAGGAGDVIYGETGANYLGGGDAANDSDWRVAA